ncbi:MAG: flagellar assembly protein FliH [Marinagarivorans sp.]|nr:flagellar assembly protein FliH [Marinagarivorans sp.]
MSSLPPGRIPFEDIANAKSWVIPNVKGHPVNSVEQRKRKTKTRQNQVKQSQRVEPQQPVTSEEVAAPAESNHRLTAQQLEEITLAAEQDGFSKGYEEGVDRGKQDGRKAGYSDGLKAGTEQAESEHGQWLREQGEHLHALCESLMTPLAGQQQDLADAVLDIAMGLTRHLLDAELQLNPRHIVAVVDKALAALPPVEDNIQLVLHPDDQDAFQEYSPKAALIEKITTDASLARGSCKVHSQHSFVDYSVASRLDEFMAALIAKPFDEAAAALPIETVEREASAIDDVKIEECDLQTPGDDMPQENVAAQYELPSEDDLAPENATASASPTIADSVQSALDIESASPNELDRND